MSGFFSRAKQTVKNFLNSVPQHASQARTFLSGVVQKANAGARLIKSGNDVVQESGWLGPKAKQLSKRVADYSSLGISKISDIHKQADSFLAQHDGSPAGGLAAG